jgi:hypothetical protein
MAWELKGNAGTDPASTFLGTTDGKPLVIQPGSGNVGIGTTSPDTRLNINSNAPDAPAVLVISDKNADTRVGLWSGFGSGEHSPAIIYTHDLTFGIGQDFSTGQDFSEAVRITHGGSIGIGTPNPSSKVEIFAQDGLAVTGFQPFITLRDANAGNARSCMQCIDGDIGLIPNSFLDGGGVAMVLKTGSGNLGIGVGAPDSKLHVVGDVQVVANAPKPAFAVYQWGLAGTSDIMFGRSSLEEAVFRVTNRADVLARNISRACDMNVKDNFSCVSTREILEKLAGMPIQEWSYKTDPTSVRHIGPTSQDFQAAFELNGDDETNIASVDAQGIALAAIQGLNEKLNAENAQLRTSLADLERRLAALESNLPMS